MSADIAATMLHTTISVQRAGNSSMRVCYFFLSSLGLQVLDFSFVFWGSLAGFDGVFFVIALTAFCSCRVVENQIFTSDSVYKDSYIFMS